MNTITSARLKAIRSFFAIVVEEGGLTARIYAFNRVFIERAVPGAAIYKDAVTGSFCCAVQVIA